MILLAVLLPKYATAAPEDALLYLNVEFIISHLRLSPSYPIAPPRLYSAILLMKSALII